MFEIKKNEKRKKESSLILRKAKFQAIFKFVLPLASKGTEGIKYNRISAFVSMPVLLIRRSLEKFFKKNFRDDRFCFGFAKVVALTIFFTIATTAKSQAECGKTASAVGTDDNGNYCGICNDSGTCKWKLDSSGELNVYAADSAQNVAIKDYGGIYQGCEGGKYPHCYKSTAPWGGLGATSLVIGDNISNVGKWAFVGESRITSISGMNDLKSIDFVGFHMMQGLSELTLPEGLTTIGNQALQNVNIENSLTIPSSLTNVGSWAYYGLRPSEFVIPDTVNTNGWAANAFESARADITIRCQGEMEKCQAAMAKYIPISKGGTCTSYCLTNATFEPATESQCTGSSYYWSGESCNKSPTDGSDLNCTNGYKLVGNKCINCSKHGQVEWQGKCYDEYPFAKKRWTPAEANEWLHDGNDNFVVLTFKK